MLVWEILEGLSSFADRPGVAWLVLNGLEAGLLLVVDWRCLWAKCEVKGLLDVNTWLVSGSMAEEMVGYLWVAA